MSHRTPSFLAFCLGVALLLSGVAAHAQCPAGHLLYLDLVAGVSVPVPTNSPYFHFPVPLQPNGNADCAPATAYATVVRVTVPPGCHGAVVWLDYAGEPHGWTADIGDSATDNGFGGDGGTLPAGQNAELQILDQELSGYSAADNPADVDMIIRQDLALTHGAFRFEIANQSVAFGQPMTALETPDLQRLFFLPDNPVAPENRDIYVGLNRSVGSPGRNGCGLRRAMVMFD